jgi:hypothetical protein
MAHQYSQAVVNNGLDSRETTIGTAPKLYFFTGAAPANCAAADSGTLLNTGGTALPSDWLAAASAGSKAKAGAWTGTFTGAGTVGHFRIKDTAGTTCHLQGSVTQVVSLTTSALTAANGNVLTFAATTGVVTGMNVSGTGIPVGTTVVATTGTTVTLSMTSTAGVANTTAITFGGDMTLDNVVAAAAQAWTVNTFQITGANQ